MRRFLIHLWQWLHQILLAIDQLIQVIISGPRYFVYGGYTPNSQETISSSVGRWALEGNKVAIVLQWVIDRIMYGYNGWKLGHCKAAIEKIDFIRV